MMTPERWQQIADVFDAVLERGASEREVYLVQVCAGDEALRCEVESLLSAHQQAGSFIAEPALASKHASGNPMIDQKTKVFSDNLIGERLGHYTIESKLGEGGMGVVYKARDTRLGRSVAIKVLPAERTADPGRKRRFAHEARAASALNHPNIVTIYDIGQVQGSDFIAMECVDGKTLDQAIPPKGMRVVDALKYAVQIADALAAAHGAGSFIGT
jgi:serine/threonine protein kinase